MFRVNTPNKTVVATCANPFVPVPDFLMTTDGVAVAVASSAGDDLRSFDGSAASWDRFLKNRPIKKTGVDLKFLFRTKSYRIYILV
jgi:hypothetical protein